MEILPSKKQALAVVVAAVVVIGSCIAFGAVPGLVYLIGSYAVCGVGLYKDYKHGHDISPRNFSFWAWVVSPVLAPFALYGMIQDAWNRHKRTKNEGKTVANG